MSAKQHGRWTDRRATMHRAMIPRYETTPCRGWPLLGRSLQAASQNLPGPGLPWMGDDVNIFSDVNISSSVMDPGRCWVPAQAEDIPATSQLAKSATAITPGATHQALPGAAEKAETMIVRSSASAHRMWAVGTVGAGMLATPASKETISIPSSRVLRMGANRSWLGVLALGLSTFPTRLVSMGSQDALQAAEDAIGKGSLIKCEMCFPRSKLYGFIHWLSGQRSSTQVRDVGHTGAGGYSRGRCWGAPCGGASQTF
mmetsp:Transcript_58302/g.185822  ORF Transcript_58302/g.185822 Transcript_58302/m.185822 type:complete len:257 (-) Transcript_58302:185-955(-)